jgi:hypothetical protein
MFTKTQISNMNYDMKYSSSPWITVAEDKGVDVLYKLYPTNNNSISSGREYIDLPADNFVGK